MRKVEFANEEYYHIFNRGVDKREVFLCEKDYSRFLRSVREFNQPKPIESLYRQDQLRRVEVEPLRLQSNRSGSTSLVEIICYCLNPNHYHFILKQKSEKGVEKFMHKLSTGYTRYFNEKNKRSGALFQGRYKSVHINSNEKLFLLSAYVNANNFIHGYNKNFNWPYSSLPDYLGKRNGTLCDKFPVLGQFKNVPEYAKFINDNAFDMKEKKEDNKYLEE